MKRGGEKGFTLLELLVALTLSALLITVLALGLRSGLVSWMNLKKSNQTVVPQRSVEALLTRQLREMVVPTGQGGESASVFLGKKQSLTFTTTYAPIGTEAAGVILVAYSQEKTGTGLLYAQRVLTRLEELPKILPVDLTSENIAGLRKKGWVTARVALDREWRFAYQRDDDAGEKSPEQWKDGWEDEGGIPSSVAIQWREAKDGRSVEAPWRIFDVAPFHATGKNNILTTTITPPGPRSGSAGVETKAPGLSP